MKTKQCTLCREVKLLFEFSKHRLSKDGLCYWCKECHRKRSKIFRHTPSGIYTQLKGRNKFYKNKPFNLERDNFLEWYALQERVCIYCEIKEIDLKRIKDCYNNKNTRLSVDCKDNNVGYQMDNLVLACYRCNSIKSNILTFDEMMYVGQNFIKPKWEAQLRTMKNVK